MLIYLDRNIYYRDYDDQTQINDDEIIKKGDEALIKELGISGYRRYLRLHRLNNPGRDYLTIQEDMYGEASVEQVFDNAAQKYGKNQDGN